MLFTFCNKHLKHCHGAYIKESFFSIYFSFYYRWAKLHSFIHLSCMHIDAYQKSITEEKVECKKKH